MPRISGNFSPVNGSWSSGAVNGALATTADWIALLADLSAALTQSVSKDGQTVLTGNLNTGGFALTNLPAGDAVGESLRWEQLFSQGVETDLASAATTDIGLQNTNFLRVTGTTTITSFGTNYNGPRFLRFAGALTLTNSATLILPGAANITTVAGDTLIVIPKATAGTADGWQVVAYQRNSTPAANAMGFKNRLINGQLLINQRAVTGSVVLTAGSYGHDRFKAGASGCSYTFSTTANVTTITISAGSLMQIIEGLNLESGTYVLSWAGTAQGRIGGGTYGTTGTVTGSVVGGTNTTVEFNTGTLSLPQLEKGSTATSFDYRPYGTEFMLCQRYLPCFTGVGTYGNGIANLTTNAAINILFKTPTRVPVTGIISPNTTFFNLFDSATNTVLLASGIGFILGGTEGAIINCGAGPTLTQYRPYILYGNNVGASLLFTGAEL
jgi:hypothetical protein